MYEVNGEEKIFDAMPESDMKKQVAQQRHELRLSKNEFISSLKIGIGVAVEYILIKTNRENNFEVGRCLPRLKMREFEILKNETI